MTLDDQQVTQGARLDSLIKALKLNGKQFSIALSISQSFISQMCGGKRPITHKIINKITNSYADVNAHWLLTGEGSMFLSKTQPTKPAIERVQTEPGVLPINIISIRKRWGMSQSEFADVIGVSRFVVGHWERGRNTPSYEEMATLEQLSGYNHNTLRTRELLTTEIPAKPQAPTPDVTNPIEDIRERLERIEGLLKRILGE